ncbi:unnamed protein product [Blepharisma stoltei]|uniref:Uncharacterized protein n=1 Tax=Blepharisma stoltei TaxID=1481888 RepID=A0AAU9JHM8_9CILI|nr:unnamed protein product [Blepharisma stoltei]
MSPCGSSSWFDLNVNVKHLLPRFGGIWPYIKAFNSVSEPVWLKGRASIPVGKEQLIIACFVSSGNKKLSFGYSYKISGLMALPLPIFSPETPMIRKEI